MEEFLVLLVATCRVFLPVLILTLAAICLLANTSSSGIEVSGNRAQRNYGYACDSKQSDGVGLN